MALCIPRTVPVAPSIQGSDIRDAKVDDSKNLMKFDLDGGSSFFMIMLMILIFLVVIVVMPVYCCGCSPYKLHQKRNEKKWKLELVQMIEQRNRLDAQALQQGQLVGRELYSSHCHIFFLNFVVD